MMKHGIRVFGFVNLLLISTCLISCSDDAPTGGSGGAWLRVPGEYATIQAAVDAAEDGDKILVSPGTYAESVDIYAKTIALVGDTVNFRVVLRPGEQRYPALRLVDCPSRATLLIGFIIEGSQDAPGIDCVRSSPTIHKNHIRDNEGATGGGIRLSVSGSALITANWIYRNSAVNGGGIAMVDAAADVMGNVVDSNWAYSYGGAVYCRGEPAHLITGNTFVGNRAQHRGGGIHFDEGGAVTVSGNLFFADTARFGGGIHNEARDDLHISNNTFDHCVIRQKVNYTGGGAAIQWEHTSAVGGVIKHNIVANTWSNWFGAISAGPAGAGETELDFNLVWKNDPTDYHGFTPGPHSLVADPRFCDWQQGDFHLQADSPCVGTGENGVTIGAFAAGCAAVSE